MPENISTCQGPWDILPEGTGQEASLDLLSETPGNMPREPDHTGQGGGKSDVIRELLPISNFMTLCKKDREYKSFQNKITRDLAWKAGSMRKQFIRIHFSGGQLQL